MKSFRFFQSLAAIHGVFACIVLANELMAISNRVPGGNYPIEHQNSWAKVFLFCAGAAINFLLIWTFRSREGLLRFMPPFHLVLLFAVFLTISSIGLSHYLSRIGWCCEHPFAFYFGFPFSFLFGVGGFDPETIQYSYYNFFEVLNASELLTTWEFHPYPFFLSFLFWSGVFFIFISLGIFLIQWVLVHRQVEKTNTV